MSRSRHILLILPVVLACLASSARAQDSDRPQIVGVRLGFNGLYKVGYWTPLEVILKGGAASLDGQIEVTVPDGDGVLTHIFSPDGRLVHVGARQAALAPQLLVKIGQSDYEMEVVFRVEGKVAARRKFNSTDDDALAKIMPADKQLIVVLGGSLGIDSGKQDSPDNEKQVEVARVDDLSQLPTRWFGYEGVDTLVALTSDAEPYRRLQGNDRAAALEQWVRLGGELLLSAGKNAPEIFAAGAPLASFAPGRLDGSLPLRQSSPIETYAGTSERLDAAAEEAGQEFRLSIPRFADVTGQVEAFAGADPRELPLVVRTPLAFGEVTYTAFDLDGPPVRNWPGRPALVDRLLDRVQAKHDKPAEANGLGRVTTMGYSDLAGQLRAALDQFEGVQPVAFWFVALLIVLYILCIGPFDYLLVKRVLKKVELTWFTFPAIVALFSVGAYALAYQLKGEQLCLNQVNVVDVDLETSLLRGTSWSNLFSPRIDSYNLSLAPRATDADHPPETLVSWMGLPGEAFGGMSGGGGGALLGNEYAFSPSLDALDGLPIAVWSTKGVMARWHTTADTMLDSALTDSGERLLDGTLTSQLDFPLSDCLLLYDRWVYSVGSLAAGGEIRPGKDNLDPQTVETWFRRGGAAGRAEPYDQASLDVPRILEAMMCHDASGGTEFTRLTNQYQRFVDLSGHLRIGRAILIGRAEHQGARLLRDGQPIDGQRDRHWTYYRFVLPVDRSKAVQ